MKKNTCLFLCCIICGNLLAASAKNSEKEKTKVGFNDPDNGFESVSWPTPYGEIIPDDKFISDKGLKKAEEECSEVLLVEKIQVKDCRAVRGFTVHPVDGRVDSRGYGPRHQLSEWPFRFSMTAVSYGIIYYHKKSMADGLHIKLEDKKGFNAIIVRSQEGFKGNLVKDNNKLSFPWNGSKICGIDGKHKYKCLGFNELILTDSLSFTNKEDNKTLGDVSFLRVGKFATKKKYPGALTYFFSHKSAIPASLKFYFDMHFNKDKHINFLSMFPTTKKEVEVFKSEPSGYIHFMLPPQKEEIYLGAVKIHLGFADFKKGERAIISIQDPLSPKRDLASYAFPIGKDGKINAELDFPDQIVPANKPLWIKIKTSNPSIFDVRITLLIGDKETTLKEYLQYRLTLLKGNFATRSEPRPYMRPPVLSHELEKREALIKENKKGGEVLREMYESLDELKRLYPDNPVVKTYYDWIYFKEGSLLYPKNMTKLPVKKGEEKNAPDWAVTIRNGIKELLDISKWWLDNRQIENGEFGGMVNDDTCLLQQFYGISLISDGETGKRIKEACRTLNELAEKHTLVKGINKTRMDPLHGYEEGINMRSMMPLLFYGDPVDFERLMLTARSVKKLTFDKNGKRYFKKYYYNVTNLESDDVDFQNRSNFLLLQPASMIAWYNQNQEAADFINSVIRGVIAYGRNGLVPLKINVKDGCVPEGTKYSSILGYMFGLPIITMTISGVNSMKYLKAFLTPEGYARFQDRVSPPLGKAVWMESYNNLEGLVNRIERDNRRNKYFKYIYTKAEIFTDRIFTDKQALLNATIGARLVRNSWAPTQFASYEGFGENFAPLLLETRQSSLKIAFYNFNQKDISGSIRVWRLEHGKYKIDCGPDSDNDGKIDKIKQSFTDELAKYSSIPVKIPPKQTWIINVSQLEKLDDIKQRPDLAISSREIKVDKKAGKINFVVHNIGAKPSGNFTVSLFDGDKKLQDIQVKNLEAPKDLFPKKKQLCFDNVHEGESLKIIIDPEHKIQEITKVNNITIIR
jgi:CARDB protein